MREDISETYLLLIIDQYENKLNEKWNTIL
jgi:hypothetical protein